MAPELAQCIASIVVSHGVSRVEGESLVETSERFVESFQAYQTIAAIVERIGQRRIEGNRLIVLGKGVSWPTNFTKCIAVIVKSVCHLRIDLDSATELHLGFLELAVLQKNQTKKICGVEMTWISVQDLAVTFFGFC